MLSNMTDFFMEGKSMIKKIKDYIEYRKNLRAVKKELVKAAATTLPLVSKTASNALRLVNFATYVMEECAKLGGDNLADRLQEIISDAIKTFAAKFETDESSLFETVQYIARMSPEEIRKVALSAQEKE